MSILVIKYLNFLRKKKHKKLFFSPNLFMKLINLHNKQRLWINFNIRGKKLNSDFIGSVF